MKTRCSWCGTDRVYVDYHDCEWGVPVYDDRHLFEMLVLEGTQAGLSWLTILKKRQAYRIAFKDFAINTVAAYTDHDLQRLLLDTGIVRNRKKIESAITNARAVRAIQKEFGSFGKYIWQFVGALPRQNAWKTHEEIPVRTEQSDAMSSDLRKRGCSFVGSTICYAFMQAVGMVNDHVVGCYRYAEINALHY